jgi:hypothetical protein
MNFKNLVLFSSVAVLGMSSLSAFADSATDALGISSKFPGDYQLVSAQGKAGCAEKLHVVATSDYVTANSEYYYKKDSGCESHEGDIGPVRNECTKFYEKEVNSTMTSPVTIVGYVSEYSGIKLGAFDSDTIVYQHDNTEIPFGITGIWDGEKFKCTYKRISE